MNLVPKKARRATASARSMGTKSTCFPSPSPAGVPAPSPAGVPATPPARAAAPTIPASDFGAHPSAATWWTASGSGSECLYPPGGFVKYIQSPNGNQLPENFHLVGTPISRSVMSPIYPQMGSQENKAIDIDVDDDDDDDAHQHARTEVRLNWSHAEDVRLCSAWLLNSLDPVDGNDKKADQYWGDVTATYNKTTPSHRSRNRNQLKIHWERIKKPVGEFHGCWTRIKKVYQSGVSDDQLKDQAMELYASEHKDKIFTLEHAWKVLGHERKWSAYVKKMQEKENTDKKNPVSVVNIEDSSAQRPIGHKKAKEERNGKRKSSDISALINEKLKKIIEASTKAREGREKMAEVQENLADKKLQAAQLTHKTAREKTKCKMMEASRRFVARRYVDRPREEAKQRLMDDYFSENPVYNDTIFRRRFRMRRPLFLRIVDALGVWSPFFTLRLDGLNRPGLSPIQKCTAAIRQLANGSPADQLDEYIKIGESTAVECLKMFVKGVIEIFKAEYLRRPSVQDVERLIQVGERRGFPGMLGSIDCMHWHWERCPYAWKGMYTRGDHSVPAVILEAVASHDRWIWHAFFGVAGSNNDINVLNQSDLFTEKLRGEAPIVQYHINGRLYNQGYYLADGIYLSGLHLLSQYDTHNLMSINCLHNIKKGQGRMLNVHLGFCNPDFVFCADRHDYMIRVILKISC